MILLKGVLFQHFNRVSHPRQVLEDFILQTVQVIILFFKDFTKKSSFFLFSIGKADERIKM